VVAALVVPGIAIMVFSMLIPLGFSLYFSFTDWDGLGALHKVGFDNYRAILTDDPVFWRALWNTFLLMVATVFIQNPVAFALAALLAHVSARFSRILRTIYFIPAVLSLVIVAKLWVSILNPTYGLLNKVLVAVGLKALAVSWLSNPNTALASVIFIILWQGFGWALLFFYAGLMTVPRDIEEAARVDGANWFQTYVLVVIPYLLPVITAVVIIDVISSMKQMELIYLSTGGGPGSLTQFVSVYLYQKAFVAGEYGYGNALSVLFVIMAVGLTLVIQRAMRTVPDEG
jgi:raffinose/stachyose/melibiose transport system permease protein